MTQAGPPWRRRGSKPLQLARALPAGEGKGAEALVREGEVAARSLDAPRVFGSANRGRDSMCVPAGGIGNYYSVCSVEILGCKVLQL